MNVIHFLFLICTLVKAVWFDNVLSLPRVIHGSTEIRTRFKQPLRKYKRSIPENTERKSRIDIYAWRDKFHTTGGEYHISLSTNRVSGSAVHKIRKRSDEDLDLNLKDGSQLSSSFQEAQDDDTKASEHFNELLSFLPVKKIVGLTGGEKEEQGVSRQIINYVPNPEEDSQLQNTGFNTNSSIDPLLDSVDQDNVNTFYVDGVAESVGDASYDDGQSDSNYLGPSKMERMRNRTDSSEETGESNSNNKISPTGKNVQYDTPNASISSDHQEDNDGSGECSEKHSNARKKDTSDEQGQNTIEVDLNDNALAENRGKVHSDGDDDKIDKRSRQIVQEIKFPKNYHATGILSLPYDDIQEPFEAWYAGGKNLSRIDYYYGMDKTYQRGDIGKYGVLVKLTPAHWAKKGSLDQNTYSCWFREEPKWSPQRGQSVIPLKLRKFKLIKEENFNGVPAYKLQYQKRIEQKNNTYTFYVTRSKPHIPLRYEMVGFDHLLSSHYDNYVLDYITFKKWDFDFEILKIPKKYKCYKQLKKLKSRFEANPMSEFLHDEETGHREKETQKMFAKYKNKHGKRYSSELEDSRRKDLFRHNTRYIHSKNRENLNFSLAVNSFADITDHEFELYKGLMTGEDERALKREIDQIPVLRLEIPKQPLPDELDWRDYGAVTKVKSQSSCGACWAFSAIGVIEGAYSIQSKELDEFSEQQLIDCSWGYMNNGCRGGWSWRALNWIRDNGIATKATYGKYLGQEGYCHCDKKDNCTVIKNVSYKTIEKHSKEKLKTALARFGPASLAVHCDRKTFKFFGSGIYDDPKCNHKTDHAVLVVGFGVEHDQPYWIIKNSWGVLWGDGGYMKIAMENDLCGVLQNGALVASIKKWKDAENSEYPFHKMRKINYQHDVEGDRQVRYPIGTMGLDKISDSNNPKLDSFNILDEDHT